MEITTKDINSQSWQDIVALFGSKGACGGCWCQAWRFGKGEKWSDLQGEPAKERLHQQVLTGTAHAIIAYDGVKPIGWCTYDPRLTFRRIERARTLKCDDADAVWSIPCFFVIKGYRKMGVATLMLNHALDSMKKLGATIAEAYPTKPNKEGEYIDAFAFTGTQSLFKKAGFTIAGNSDGSKQRVRKLLT